VTHCSEWRDNHRNRTFNRDVENVSFNQAQTGSLHTKECGSAATLLEHFRTFVYSNEFAALKYDLKTDASRTDSDFEDCAGAVLCLVQIESLTWQTRWIVRNPIVIDGLQLRVLRY